MTLLAVSPEHESYIDKYYDHLLKSLKNGTFFYKYKTVNKFNPVTELNLKTINARFKVENQFKKPKAPESE